MPFADLRSPTATDAAYAQALQDVVGTISLPIAAATVILIAVPGTEDLLSVIRGGLPMVMIKLATLAVGVLALLFLSILCARSPRGATFARGVAPWVLTYLAGIALCLVGLVGLSLEPELTIAASLVAIVAVTATVVTSRTHALIVHRDDTFR
jgi:hypothetical protein